MTTPKKPTNVPYLSAHDDDFAAAIPSFTMEEGDGWIRLSGTCSRCHHDTTSPVYYEPVPLLPGLVVQSWGRKKPKNPVVIEDLVRCECSAPHDGRPDDAVGCGAMSYLKVTVQP